MRDLELRGAGNLLGDEQSGHVAAVGFELYCELLAEAVVRAAGPGRRGRRRAAGRSASTRRSTRTCRPTTSGLESAKMDVHRRIALASTVDELRDVEAELVDRFGPLPDPVRNLVLLQEARLVLAPLGGAAPRRRPRARHRQRRDARRVRAADPSRGPAGAARGQRPGVRCHTRSARAEAGMEAGLELAAAIIAVRSGTVPVPS